MIFKLFDVEEYRDLKSRLAVIGDVTMRHAYFVFLILLLLLLFF